MNKHVPPALIERIAKAICAARSWGPENFHLAQREASILIDVIGDFISRKEAIARGIELYFTGEPCRSGHVSERFVSSGRCVQCRQAAVKKYRQKNRETLRDKNSERKRKAARAFLIVKKLGIEL